MNLVRFQHPYQRVNRNLVDELFRNMMNSDYDDNYSEGCGCKPAANIFETSNDFQLELLLPGFRKEDVQLSYHENVLTVKSDLPEQKEEEKASYKFASRAFGVYSFERKFRVPKSVDGENITAQFENGVLRLVLPKRTEALEKAPVEIKIG